MNFVDFLIENNNITLAKRIECKINHLFPDLWMDFDELKDKNNWMILRCTEFYKLQKTIWKFHNDN